MPESLLTVLGARLLPALENLTVARLILPQQAGKPAVGAYAARGGVAEHALEDGADLPGASYSYQGHPTLELVFGVQGAAELALAGHRYVLGEGDAAIVAPNVPHLERIHSRAKGYHLLWFRVAPDRIAIHSSSYSRGNRFQLIRGASIAPSGAIGRTFELATEEALTRGTAWFSLVRARLVEGMALAIRHIETHGPGQDPSNARRSVTDVAKAFIQSHFSEDLTLDRIAGEVFLSPNYFSSLFTQAEGKTVFAYLHEVRVDEARRLLAETELPIRQVARRVGIPSASYFCRLFRRASGVAAKDFRANAVAARRKIGQ